MEELNDYTEPKEESSFDLKAEIFKYLIHWKWLVLGVLLGGGIAYLYNRYTIPKYWTGASMMIVNEQEKNAMSALPSGGGAVFSLQEGSLENQIETLRSKQLVESVVDELNHNISYFIEGNVITVEAYKSSPVVIDFITPDSIVNRTSLDLLVTPVSDSSFQLEVGDGEYSQPHSIGEVINMYGLEFRIMPRVDREEGTFRNSNSVNIKIAPVSSVANEYISVLEISKKGQAQDILSLGIVQETTGKSQDFLNKLMERFNEEGVRAKQEVAENTTRFIQERLEIISEELDSVEGGMADFKRSNRIMDINSGASEFRSKYSAAEQRIFELETQITLIESVSQYLESRQEHQLLPSDIGISEGGISGLIITYNTLVMERNIALKNSTQEHPTVQNINDQLSSLRQNLRENIASTLRSINIQLKDLSQREQMAQGEFSTFPGLERGIRGIERQQQIKEQLYLFLLQRREEAAISFAATASVARVVDPAFTYNDPIDPKPWVILAGGLAIGLLIPLLVIFIKNLLDTKIHHKGDLQPLIKHVPFLGEIPRVDKEHNEFIQVNDRSPLAESFRILRTNLAYLVQNKDRTRGEIIFVTSTIKGEGKTFVSFNMARTLATTKKKVLLIGADIRNPKLHRYSEQGHEAKGLSDFLYDYSLTFEDILTSGKEEGITVDMILSGGIPPNPAELFMSDRMKQLLDQAAQFYDYIIVDTAPTMIVTDTLLISPLADTTLYITRADFTDKKLLNFPKDLKQQGKLKGLAVILNDVDYSKFSYGAKYGYSYGYGYGYGADKEPTSRWKPARSKEKKART